MSTPLRALVVDDEPRARHVLRVALTHYVAGVAVVAEADGLDAAAAAVASARPNLIFLDVDLGGDSGLELFERCDLSAAGVVMVTAYTEYAIAALRREAVDYLVKPVNVVKVREAVSRVRCRLSPARPARRRMLSVPHDEGRRFVPHDELVLAVADGAYARLHLTDGTELFVARKLGSIERDLASDAFLRCHRSYLANAAHVRAFRGPTLHMTNGLEAPVSRSQAPAVRKTLLACDGPPA